MKYTLHYMMMLKVASLIRLMPIGQGWTIARDFHTWSALSKSTVYRMLPKMVNQGLLELREHKKGERRYREYRITNVGQEFLNSQKELF